MGTFTSDNRPHVLGDLIAITGTVANGDTDIDLSDFMSEVLMATLHPLEGAAGPTTGSCVIDGTTVKFNDPGVAAGGRLFALGKR
tara:strand:- start:2124 stop:2378 length:255 start_codon:yes stop_codon:yes gene_type:complete